MMTSGKYILDGHKAVPCDDLLKWVNFFEDREKRRIALTEVPGGMVSTVFLGIDHRFTTDGEPLVFETMVFGGPTDGDMERYSTWEQAEAGHAKIVALAKVKHAEC